jgi:hypothetical protein
MTPEPLFAAIAKAVFGSLLQESSPAERTRAALGLDPTRRAFQTALGQTYAAFARRHPEWTAALFDETFFNIRDVVPLLAKLLTRNGRPDPAHLAHLFAAHLGRPDPDRWERLSEATRAAAATPWEYAGVVRVYISSGSEGIVPLETRRERDALARCEQ